MTTRRYCGFIGDRADRVAENAITKLDQAVAIAQAFAEIGIGEIMFFPTIASLTEINALADAVL